MHIFKCISIRVCVNVQNHVCLPIVFMFMSLCVCYRLSLPLPFILSSLSLPLPLPLLPLPSPYLPRRSEHGGPPGVRRRHVRGAVQPRPRRPPTSAAAISRHTSAGERGGSVRVSEFGKKEKRKENRTSVLRYNNSVDICSDMP